MNAFFVDVMEPLITPVGDRVLLILPLLNRNENASPEDMVSIGLWVDPHRIISFQKQKLKAIDDWKVNIEAGQGTVD